MSIEEDIKDLEKKLKEETDIAIGIRELFKDTLNSRADIEHHDVDIRTRLIQKEISSMSVSNFLGTIKIGGLKNSKDLMTDAKPVKVSMTEPLGILMFQIKRHKISMQGQSRKEIIDVLKGTIERESRKGGIFGNWFGNREM